MRRMNHAIYTHTHTITWQAKLYCTYTHTHTLYSLSIRIPRPRYSPRYMDSRSRFCDQREGCYNYCYTAHLYIYRRKTRARDMGIGEYSKNLRLTPLAGDSSGRQRGLLYIYMPNIRAIYII